MKRILSNVTAAALFAGMTLTAAAQKTKEKEKDDKVKSKTKEIIIMRDSDKDTKLTIETKDGEVFINGKPASEYKDDNVRVVPGAKNFDNFVYSPNGTTRIFSGNDWNGEKKAFLGVSTEKADNGVKITNVNEGSAADKAGLKEGDVITKVGDKKVSDPEELTDAVTSHKPKEEVNITYERAGKSNSVKAALGEQSGWSRSFSSNGNDFKMNNDWMKDFNKNFKNDFQLKEPLTIGGAQGFKYFMSGGRKLGISIEDTDDETGVKVTDVEKESAGEKAGLKQDDIITEVGGKKVKNVREVLDELKANREKSSYSIKAKRNGSEMTFEVKIPKKKSNADI